MCKKTNSQFVLFIYSNYLSLFCIWFVSEGQKRAAMLHIVRFHFVPNCVMMFFQLLMLFPHTVDWAMTPCWERESTVNLLFYVWTTVWELKPQWRCHYYGRKPCDRSWIRTFTLSFPVFKLHSEQEYFKYPCVFPVAVKTQMYTGESLESWVVLEVAGH